MGNTFRDREIASAATITATLAEIGQRYGATPAQVALRWVIEQGALPIPGAKNGAQGRENAGALSLSLPTSEVAYLEERATGWLQGTRWKRTPRLTVADT